MRRRFRPALAIAVALVVGTSLLIAYYRYVRARVGLRNCAANLHLIGQATFVYANEHDGRLPDSFQTLAGSGDLKAIVFVCPLDDRQDVDPTAPAEAARLSEEGHLSYVYTGRGLSTAELSSKVVLAFEPLADHGNGVNVLLGDGSVEFVDEHWARAVIARAAGGSSPVTLPP